MDIFYTSPILTLFKHTPTHKHAPTITRAGICTRRERYQILTFAIAAGNQPEGAQAKILSPHCFVLAEKEWLQQWSVSPVFP